MYADDILMKGCFACRGTYLYVSRYPRSAAVFPHELADASRSALVPGSHSKRWCVTVDATVLSFPTWHALCFRKQLNCTLKILLLSNTVCNSWASLYRIKVYWMWTVREVVLLRQIILYYLCGHCLYYGFNPNPIDQTSKSIFLPSQ